MEKKNKKTAICIMTALIMLLIGSSLYAQNSGNIGGQNKEQKVYTQKKSSENYIVNREGCCGGNFYNNNSAQNRGIRNNYRQNGGNSGYSCH